MNRCVFDIEANGLLDTITRVWSLVVRDLQTGEKFSYTPDEIQTGLKKLEEYDVLIGHNIIGYDLPALARTMDWHKYESKRVVDTLVISRYLWPERPWGHSLEDWGVRLGNPKIHFDQWDHWSEEMQTYCEQDVDVNVDILHALEKEFGDILTGFEVYQPSFDYNAVVDRSILTGMECEHHVQRIITRQEINGVVFNERRARFYVFELEARKLQLYAKIRPYLQLEVIRSGSVPVNKPFLKSGDYSSQVTKWYPEEQDRSRVAGPFTRVNFVQPDLGSRNKLIWQLLRLGWVPENFTKKGNPKLTVEGEPCPSLLKIGSEVGQWIADWYIYNHRQSQIKGWIRRVRIDGRLTAGAITIGTPTYRFRHNVVVNVPKAASYVPFGYEMRSLFTVPQGKRMVGHDASGLELRMLANYINDIVFTREVVDGDIHTKNQNDAGLPTRDDAKTFIYAFIYGAGNLKIGRIIGGAEQDGAAIKRKFLKQNPKLASLIKSVQKAAGRGYLVGLDGRKIRLRRDKETGEIQTHKALNTLLQSGGALVMKWSMIFLDQLLREAGLHSKKVIDMHDEGQSEVPTEEATIHAELAVESIRIAGRYLDLNCPLDGEAKIGLNWAQTH
jgi:hypothetical protein